MHNLPREVASFVGREQELEECERLLGQTRILTLTGREEAERPDWPFAW
jgi:hypothetical protein